MGKSKKYTKFQVKTCLFVIVAAIMFSCSSVKFVPEDKYLLNKVEVEIDNPKLSKEEAKAFVRQKENYKILGFAKFHLWLYNLSSKNKTNDWLKRIGEPPQIYDEALSARSEDQLRQYLNSKGYFRASLNKAVNYKEKKKKANLKFLIKTGEQYRVSSVTHHISDPAFQKIFSENPVQYEVRAGSPFDFDLLEKQRLNIVNLFKNRGYYYFSKEDVRFLADTLTYDKLVELDLYIGNSKDSQGDSIKIHTPFKFNNFYISVLPGTSPVADRKILEKSITDTISWNNFSLYRNGDFNYRSNLFKRSVHMQPGAFYNLNDIESTFAAFNRLRQFRFIDIQFEEIETEQDSNLLDCQIRLAPLNKQSTSFDIEGTNTSGNMGIAGNINYQHRNLFAGAEVFQVNLKGGMERQQRVGGNNPEYFNTRELGVESNLIVPNLIGPGKYIQAFEDFLPKTVFTIGYNFQQRQEYTRTISNLKFGYDWKTTENLRHTWNLLDLNMVNLYKFNPEFIDRIQDLYIKSSFTDHLISAMNYSLIYNSQELNTKQNYRYLRFNIESAGNVLNLLAKATNQSKTTSIDTLGLGTTQYYKILNTRFAQYIKSDVEFRYGYYIDKYNSVVARAFLGVGLPYGNFDVLPFEKRYFIGGANSIRAWQVRSLGPGTYKAAADAYPNQSSDIKLEANLEYRFKLVSFLEGALFLDVGNIWAINEKDNRAGAQFEIDKFYKQLAFGTGTGFRFDFSYFVFRLDLGMKLREPSQNMGDGWIIGNRALTGNDFNLSFAIGYPF